MTKHETMEFDLSVVEIDVVVGASHYTLQEASGAASVAYQNHMMKCTEFGVEGRPQTIHNLASGIPFLVSLCLVDDKDRPVPQKTIQKWPASIQQSLFDKIKEISELGDWGIDTGLEGLLKQRDKLNEQIEEAEKELAKIEQSDTTDGLDSPAIMAG